MNNGLGELVPDVQVAHIPDGSHWCLHTKPNEVHAAIDAFLAQPRR